MTGSIKIGVDIGGTFTDLVLTDGRGGQLRLHKLLTTPADPADGVLRGLDELTAAANVSLADCESIVHGTTLVSNALIERRGHRTGLLTTAGFRDILEMGHEQRYDIYDLFLRFPEPIVPRQWRLEVSERIDRDGTVLRPLDEDEVLDRAGKLVGDGVEALAIAFLHSYKNSEHEERAAAVIREAYPKLSVSVSSEVAPEIREFERTSTTACNAYVQPLMDRYIARLESELTARGFAGRLYLMQSSGGLISPRTARTYPIRLLESGPAGGAMLGAYVGRGIGFDDVIAFDMGGTTAKICVCRDGRPELSAEIEVARSDRFKRGSGLPVKVPVLDMMEIGAGGGSIGWRTELGLLQVGPRSAGADPGPACYGKGGSEPTVTDACLALGYLDPGYFLGGSMALDVEASERTLEGLGQLLGLTAPQTAWGMHQVVCENMAAAARVHIIERGRDPRHFPIIAAGGAGPIHAARVARILGAPAVVVPPASGVASAVGFLIAPASFEFARSMPAEVQALDWNAVAQLFAELERQAYQTLDEAGFPRERVLIERSADMRLSGQFHDIEVGVPGGQISADVAPQLVRAFHAEYQRLYHSVLGGYAPTVISWRIRAQAVRPEVRLPSAGDLRPAGSEGSADRGCRSAYFPELGGYQQTPVFDRYLLIPGQTIEGPAIVEEQECTTIVNPRDVLVLDENGNLRITIGGRK